LLWGLIVMMVMVMNVVFPQQLHSKEHDDDR
jgi:hypothetical protein